VTRIYDRETKHYDRAVLTHLVETGQAQYYPAQGGIYVVKTESGTVAVRAHQVIDLPVTAVVADVVEVRVPSPMDGYHGQECYDGEDTGPGGVVYDSMLELAQEFVARCQPGTDPLRVVRDMLDDYEGEVEAGVREAVAGARQGVSAPNKGEPQRGYLSPAREDDLLRQFL
jgi:hypothetical protein